MLLLLTLSLVFNSPFLFAQESSVLADFNSGEALSQLGQPFEAWLKGDGSDKTQNCEISFVEGDAQGSDTGKILQVDYDVDSENPAYNGVRFNLEGFDASAFSKLSFYVKGDAEKGFSPNLKIEMIGANKRPSPTIVNGITSEWQKVIIPFSEFFGIRDWTNIHQLVIVFADILNDPKAGTFYFDDFIFEE